ncbi:hypothetical protein [Desulfocicer vacuolatum]|nr:hypothetical protein [Desulfocicer vacuolatum]
MKYSANQGCISNFVVGGARSECGPPVAVILENKISGQPQQSRPPDGQ